MPMGKALSELKLVTYNIRHGKGTDGNVSLRRTGQVLNAVAPDIVALQEVDRRMARSFFQDQAKTLAGYTGMHVANAPNLHFSALSAFGNALLCKYPILESGNLLLPGKMEQRGLQHCIAAIPGMGNICIFNTHLGLSAEERTGQVQSISEAVGKAPYPVLLAGDFNCFPDSPELKSLSTNLRYCAAQPVNTYPSQKPGYPIDQIYISAQWEVLSVSTYSSYASDHCPLICSLCFRTGTNEQDT